jgi:hypothetical protein
MIRRRQRHDRWRLWQKVRLDDDRLDAARTHGRERVFEIRLDHRPSAGGAGAPRARRRARVAFATDPKYAPYAAARQAGSDSRFQLIDDTDVAGTIPYLPKG